MREQAEQKFGNLWASDDFEALANLNQFAQPLSVGELTREMQLEKIRSLRNMLEAPYFARIDLRYEGEDASEAVYIGRATLRDEATHELYVHDWRSPVAGVFYRFGRGPVHYAAPGGRIDCELALKRQFEIRRGALDFFFDADVEVQDGFLRAMLSQNASPRMKAIVETIQRDQDLAIRDTEHELMMVQGAAGSGKSSIALHRVAYLMYEGLASPLSAGDILILSPNALFERYIHGVLPDLGERSVETVTLERLISKTLGGVKIEARGRAVRAPVPRGTRGKRADADIDGLQVLRSVPGGAGPLSPGAPPPLDRFSGRELRRAHHRHPAAAEAARDASGWRGAARRQAEADGAVALGWNPPAEAVAHEAPRRLRAPRPPARDGDRGMRAGLLDSGVLGARAAHPLVHAAQSPLALPAADLGRGGLPAACKGAKAAREPKGNFEAHGRCALKGQAALRGRDRGRIPRAFNGGRGAAPSASARWWWTRRRTTTRRSTRC